jgi:Amt family ammonium transporter
MFFSSWFDWRESGHVSYDVCATMNGCLTGLVSITSGCATVETWAGMVIGIFAGLFYTMASRLLIRLRIDDAVDAVPVHMVGGTWGMIATGLLSTPTLIANAFGETEHSGWFYEWAEGSGDFTLIGTQLVAVLFVYGWSFVMMGLCFGGLHKLGWFRVDELEEMAGLDVSRHKGSAYDYTEPPDGSAEKMQDRISTSRHGAKHALVDIGVEESEKEEAVPQS